MNYADIRKYDSANGPGVATTLFVSGCTHKCKGCFNSQAWDFNYGNEFTEEVKNNFIEMCKDPVVNHIAILGGEPFQQDINTMLKLLGDLKEQVSKPIWVWTGYSIETLLNDYYCFYTKPSKGWLLQYIDYIIDGKFIQEQYSPLLKWRGSKNQRIIDVKETLYSNKIVEAKELY